MLVILSGHGFGPRDAIDVEIVGASLAVVGEGFAIFETGVAGESVFVRWGCEEGERVVEVAFMADFDRGVEAGFVEVECAVGFGAAIG